jgi:hypothetical protein
MKIAQNPLKLIGHLRQWPWLAAALVGAGLVGIYRPSMLGLLLWSLCKLCFGAGLGYWVDRSIARGLRPHELAGEAKDRALLRRAIVVASAILAMALGP